ncbi:MULTISPECIES: metal-dependent hydrolase [Peribacillus]|uniref:metal-dependent hydrolase n=1 Tax=Peribacillus TaxID=2675229 RepID=UPI002079BFD0|nr:metal-dependent hydrolase [Peribacillus asahii]USK59082.1 metal-dependent hydrolase [Peribacillus asahii]USK69498.1 metal-dependent hydrolase [Peribacillus asahii]
MKVSFHGHAVVQVETNGKTILFDPFITGNSLTDLRVEDVKPDVIILTHGHSDHVGDTLELAKKHDALVVGIAELATYLGWQGVRTHGMNIGGSYEFDFGKVTLTPAFHSTGYMTVDEQIIYLGMPAGVVFSAEGKTIYHVGDTALYSDMKLIGDKHAIDLAFIPIGDNFTMGPEDAAAAAKLLQAKTVVPIHYNTFPPIKQDPNRFLELLEAGNGRIMEVGDVIEL